MELSADQLTAEYEFFIGKITSSLFYKNTLEGATHRKEACDLKGCYLRLGIFSQEEISKAYKSAEKRIEKVRNGKK